MEKEAGYSKEMGKKARGWDALEIKLKERGMSRIELEEARKSFFEGVEVLAKMFLMCYGDRHLGDSPDSTNTMQKKDRHLRSQSQFLREKN